MSWCIHFTAYKLTHCNSCTVFSSCLSHHVSCPSRDWNSDMVFKHWDYLVIFWIDGNHMIINSFKPSREKQLKRGRFFTLQRRCNIQGTFRYSGRGYGLDKNFNSKQINWYSVPTILQFWKLFVTFITNMYRWICTSILILDSKYIYEKRSPEIWINSILILKNYSSFFFLPEWV